MRRRGDRGGEGLTWEEKVAVEKKGRQEGGEGLTWEEKVAVEEKGRQGRRGVDRGREGGS